MTEIPVSRPLMDEWTQTVKEAHDIAITIDGVGGGTFIWLKGWYYWKNPVLSNLAKIYLALKNEQQILCFNVERTLRQDVAEAMGNGAYHVGFTCRIPEEDLMLKEGDYRIGLVVETPVTHTRRINWSLTMLKESDRGKE